MRIRHEHQGRTVICISVDGQEHWFYFKVASFGAKYSARVGAPLLRFLHHSIFHSHAAWIYVDDVLALFRKDFGEMGAIWALAFFTMLGVPVSWAKLQMGNSLVWIGWNLTFHAGVFGPLFLRTKFVEFL